LDPGGVITRHVDIENYLRKTVRIHIPLIIPEGDVYLEVRGVELDWSNLFAFDNGDWHSAYNKTEKRRLVYIIDISRSFLGIPEIGRG
jgi:aspartyl/asparaginyl beta-hydroxylase (cupin superfamily)